MTADNDPVFSGQASNKAVLIFFLFLACITAGWLVYAYKSKVLRHRTFDTCLQSGHKLDDCYRMAAP